MRGGGSEGRARAALCERLAARRSEIEEAVGTRVASIADPGEVADPAYAEGLRASVAVAVEYAIDSIEAGEGRAPPIPVALLGQARLAARDGVALGTVLRRYFAGYSLIGYFLIEEVSDSGLMSGAEMRRLAASQAALFDRLLAAIGEEHARETQARRFSPGRREAERVERLLTGESLDTAQIAYDFEGAHVGLVASGAGAERAVGELLAPLDCRSLLIRREEGLVWLWLGARRLDLDALLHAGERQGECSIALGEPADGIAGWRLTHRQALAALRIAERGPERAVRYRDVALRATILRDELLVDSLQRLYLEPLEAERDGGATLRRTLCAYFAAQRNSTSAAAALGVTRQTVNNHLRVVENRLGQSLDACTMELEAALSLAELEVDLPTDKTFVAQLSTSSKHSAPRP